MKSIKIDDLKSSPNLYRDIAGVFAEDGLVIFPGLTSYRLGVSALSSAAIAKLQQAKRRAQNKPSLVFINDPSQLERIVAHVPDVARQLMANFWPGPLTLRFAPSADLPSKVRKALSKATGKIGIRIPITDVCKGVIDAFGEPLLVSSANRSKKGGAQSLAQVRKNFANLADVFIDAGDLPPGKPSTVVDIDGDRWKLIREGAISEAEIQEKVHT
jgi:L-threonylcarbamoyladenylate synthase